MLARLSIRDVVLIDRLDLEFSKGLTVLTGETGAGKSILLDALSLSLGARGDGGLVRNGQAQGQVTAVFELPPGHPAHAFLEGQDIDIGDDLILRRVQFADGRTRAYVNDQSVGAQTLRSLALTLVEIHGQHDERALTDAATHRALIDLYGGLEALVQATETAFAALRDTEHALESERSRVSSAEADADFARHAHAELSRLDVKPGEEDALAARRQAMMQGEKVAADIREARDHLGGEAAVLPTLLAASRRLQRRMSQAPALIEPSVKALDEAIEALEAASRSLEQALDASEFDPHELERCEERLFALRAMGRKYGVPVDSLPALAQELRKRVSLFSRRRTRGRSQNSRPQPSVRARPTMRPLGALYHRPRASARAPMGRLPPNCRRSSSSGREFSVDLRQRQAAYIGQAATIEQSLSSCTNPVLGRCRWPRWPLAASCRAFSRYQGLPRRAGDRANTRLRRD